MVYQGTFQKSRIAVILVDQRFIKIRRCLVSTFGSRGGILCTCSALRSDPPLGDLSVFFGEVGPGKLLTLACLNGG